MELSDHPLWRRPRHHLDLEHASDHVHWVELFYDLVQVVTVFLLGNYLSHHVDWVHGLIAGAVFTATWFAWADSAVFNSLYVSTDVVHRALMALKICSVMLVAAAIPTLTEGGWAYFAGAYALNRLWLALCYARVREVSETARGLASEMTRHFLVLAGVFAVSAFLPAPWSYVCFGLGIVGIQWIYMSRRFGALRLSSFAPRLGHISERFSLLYLIVLGEGFFKLVITLSEQGPAQTSVMGLVNFFLGALTLFVLAWMYFDFVGNGKPKSGTLSHMVAWWLAHLALMFCAFLMCVALAGVSSVEFDQPFPFGFGVVGCIGLIGFLLSTLVIRSTSEPRLAHRAVPAGLAYFGVAMALVTLVVLPYAPAWLCNVFWGVAVFSQVGWPLWHAKRILASIDAPSDGAH